MHFSVQEASLAPFDGLLGLPWAAFWRPISFQNGPRELQEASRSVPRGFHERPISPWKPPLSRPSIFESSKRPPRGLQGLPGTPPGLKMDLRTARRDIPEACQTKRPLIQVPRLHFWTSLGPGPLARQPRPGGMHESD